MALNLEKLERERMRFRHAFKHAPQATHFGGTFTNKCVEGTRASPYWAGHVLAVLSPLCVLGWALWVATMIYTRVTQ